MNKKVNTSDFPPLSFSRSYFTQWLLKDTPEDCIIWKDSPLLTPSTTGQKSPRQSVTSSPSSAAKSSANNNERNKHHYPHHHHQHSSSSSSSTSSPNHHKRNNMELIQLLAINALEFTAPVYSFLNKSPTSSPSSEDVSSSSMKTKTTPPEVQLKKKSSTTASTTLAENTTDSTSLSKKTSTELKLEREFIQLSGHPGSFAPAGPNSIWKKMPNDSINEAEIYQSLKESPTDPINSFIPTFISRTNYNGTEFIELEDLITRFDLKSLSIVDIKLGIRTFLESEVKNTTPRTDLYQKMYKIDPSALSEEENISSSVTKLRYMTFRERLSSTNSLGFRIEGVKLSKIELTVNYQRLKDEQTIGDILTTFCGKFKSKFYDKLVELRDSLEKSEFFRNHEMIGSSLLMIHDENQCGIWIIDFAKTFYCENLNHRTIWELGNREDGYLIGLDNVIRLIQ